MKYKVRESGEPTRDIEVPFVVKDGMTYQGKLVYGTISNRSHGQGVFYVREIDGGSETY